VSNLPPPLPPSASGGPGAAGQGTPPGSTPRSTGLPEGWDWDRVRGIAEGWYRPLLDIDAWKALGYLSVGMITSIGFFTVMTVLGSIAFGLVFALGIGLLLIGPFFRVVEAFAAAERRMAGWVGVEIPPRPLAPRGRLGFGALTDRERWRFVAYLAINMVLAPILFAFGSFAHSIVLQVVFGDGFASPGIVGLIPITTVLALAFAAFLLGAAPRLALFFADVKARITGWFLGPDELAIAQQRVSTLSSQRQDILDAVASERRRIERNLHDGVQQQLVAIGLDLGMAEQQIDKDPDRARELMTLAREKVQGSIGELRQLGRGLHPAILEDRGLDAALSAVVSGAQIPVSVHVDADLGLSTDVAETVYFVANEAIANVLKHADARVASVHVAKNAANVRVTVHDDGRGGVDASKGTGIAGIRARVQAVDGVLSITSPDGGPTTLVAELPRHDPRAEGSSHA
jgi:signal transduction histidine kinase